MNAFSTYHQLTTIHFDEFLDHGLYLISGPTGSGKTTIFDAITFALYGKASGSDRNPSHFRSDYADVKNETYVELTFEIHQQVCTIKRSPSYQRPGYKTLKPANAYLTINGKTIEGVKEVDQQVTQLLGVDVQQFKQIVMIAQGEFTKLIYAGSDEREKVLRHLFHTESFVRLENLLKEKTKQLKDAYHFSNQQLISQFQLLKLSDMTFHDFHPSYIDQAIEGNEKIHQEYLKTNQLYQEENKKYESFSKDYYQKEQINQNILLYQKVQHDYQECLEKEEDMNQLSQKLNQMKLIQKNQALIDHYENTKKEYINIQKTLEQIIQQEKDNHLHKKVIENVYQTIPTLHQQKDQYLLDIQKLKELMLQQQKYFHIQKKYNEVQTKQTQLQKKYDKLLKKQQQLTKRIERDQENIDQLPVLEMELELTDKLVQESNQRRVLIHDLSELYDSHKIGQDRHYELTREYENKTKQYRSLFKQYQEEDEKFKRQQAGILALELEEGKPCPVCGSLHHPNPSHLSLQVLSSHELEQMLAEVKASSEKREETYQELLSQNQQIENIKGKIDICKEQLNIEEELSKEVFIRLLSNTVQITKEQEKKYQKQLTEVGYLKKLNRSVERDRFTSQKHENQLEELLEDIHELEKKLAAYQVQLNSIDENVMKENLEEKQNQVQKQFDLIDERIQDIEKQYHQISKEESLILQQKEMYERNEKEFKQNLSRYKEELETFIHDHFENEKEFLLMKKQLSTFNQQEKVYQDYVIQKTSLQSQLQNLQKYKDLEVVDLTIAKQNLDVLKSQNDALYQEVQNQNYTYQQNQSIIKKIQSIYKKNQDTLQQYTLYQDLYDYASGKNPQRLSFERYVLTAYFDMILEYANTELWKMSQGRFTLYRKQEVKGAKQQGLDLSVLDYETGVIRDIQSLSGGESFKAALSLALGLSSMIQSYAGGIELNTLFIDEGFGSLDSESLDQALSVLLELKNDHKTIGIISHVRELKERIDTQIVVEKGVKGSSLHIEKV